MKNKVIALLFIISFLPMSGRVFAEEMVFARDMSDRQYLPGVMEQIRRAEKSVEVSMYSVNLGTGGPGDGVWQLIDALKTAARNGRQVRMWLNARQASIGSTKTFLREDIQKNLRESGVQVFYVDPKRRLHDKLVIIDRRAVIEGSMNWTREALMKNFESASLIQSSGLAEEKIKRLEALPLLTGGPEPRAQESFNFPLNLLTDPKKFPNALEEKEPRTLAFYLALLEHAAKSGQNTFVIDLKDWSGKLRFKQSKLGWFLQNDMKRHLDFLKNRYGLIEWKEIEKGKAEVTLKPVTSEFQIKVPRALIEFDYLKRLSPKTLFVYLLTLRAAQKEGNAPFWIGNLDATAKDFYTNRTTVIQGLTDLKRMNLIEIYPSEKQKVEGVWYREFTNRYLLNPVLSEQEKNAAFDALRAKAEKANVEKAIKLSDSIDEPEDIEVVKQFAGFLKYYPEEDVQKATAIVSGFSRNNPLRTPAYIRGILEGERAKN